MNVVGIVAEYNPFHRGHEYHLAQSRREAEADYAVVVMSGDYVQRGAPAIMEKHKRALLALKHGADLVLELPVSYACASAEYFAKGSVTLLEKLGVVTHLSFGSEWGRAEAFLSLGEILAQEPESYRQTLKASCRQGLSFPAARARALLSYFRENGGDLPLPKEEFSAFLQSPNNILGLEYVKALRQTGSRILPLTFPRKGSGYHSPAMEEYASASGIRRELARHPDWIILSAVLPRETYALLREEYEQSYPLLEEDFSLLLRYKLMQETPSSLTAYLDLTPELACRMKNRENEFQSFSQFTDLLKTKEVTRTRISRALLHLLLGLRTLPPISYARVLGMKRQGAPLLSAIRSKGQIPLITKPAQNAPLLSPKAKASLDTDTFASNLYQAALHEKFGLPFLHEYQKPMVIL